MNPIFPVRFKGAEATVSIISAFKMGLAPHDELTDDQAREIAKRGGAFRFKVEKPKSSPESGTRKEAH